MESIVWLELMEQLKSFYDEEMPDNDELMTENVKQQIFQIDDHRMVE
jgi:hypothetical protein